MRVGVIGIGFGQQVHVPAFRAVPGCEVVALGASNFERAARVAEKLGITRAYGNWRELVEDPAIEAISIATPPALQAEIALAALANGKHVFCEKPLAGDSATAQRLAEAASQAGTANMVDFEFPEIAEWQQAKALIDSGDLGKLRHAALAWNVETYANKLQLESWKTSMGAGGGTLYSFVSHSFYYLEWLLGPISRLSASLFKPPGDPRPGDTLAVLCLELASGGIVSLSVSGAAFLGSGHRLEIYGDTGTLVLDNPTSDYVRGFRLRYGTRQSAKLEDITGPGPASEGDGRVAVVTPLISRFVRWAVSGEASHPNFQDGWRVQQLLEAARRSDETRAWVEVNY